MKAWTPAGFTLATVPRTQRPDTSLAEPPALAPHANTVGRPST